MLSSARYDTYALVVINAVSEEGTAEITWQRFRVVVKLQNERRQAEIPPPSVKLTLSLRVGLFCNKQDPNKIL